MVDQNPPTGWTPNGSTVGSGLGGALAVIVISFLSTKYPVGPILAASITTVCSVLAGYLPSGGRQ